MSHSDTHRLAGAEDMVLMLIGEVISYEDGDVVDGIARCIGDRLTYIL